jgi:PAS domain S-box-containing protein
MAPVGYLTLSDKGLIVQGNLTACTLLGVPRNALASRPLSQFILKEDQDIYYLFLKQLLKTGVPQACELRLVKKDGTAFWAQVEATVVRDAEGNTTCRIVMIDITERKQMERTRTFLARSSGGIPDEPFFNMLAAFLAKDLGMDFVCIDLLEGDGLMARTLSVWCDGKFEDNVTYALKDTPCGDVVGKTVCCFPASVCQFFPRDQVLQDLRAESYIGTTLWSHDGRPVGLIALISRRPLANRSSAEAVLKLVASRAGGEIERLLAEAALQQSEIKHGKMVANIGDVIVIIDQDGINRYKSPNSEKLFGWRPEELVGAGALDNVHPEDLDHARGFIGALLREPKAAATTQCRYRCKDGNYKWIEFTGINLLHDPDIRGILGNYQDITERKQAEEELRKKDEQFRTLTTLAPAGIYLSDADGNCLYANPAWCKMAGLQSEEALGTGWARALHPDDRDRVLSDWNHLVESQGQWGQEYRFQTRDGKVTWVYGLAAPQYDASGKITQYVGINIDITDHKLAEEEKAKLQDQLTQAQKMESVGRLAGGVAHDFNNLLMGILNYAQLCRDKVAQDHPIREWLNEITVDAERSAQLTHQLLAFARKQIIAPKVLDLSETVSGMLKLLRRLIGEDIIMNLTAHSDTWPVKMDPVQIDQILANLAVNARDAIGGVGSITIETSNATFDEAYCAAHLGAVPGDYALLTVTDTGCGMDPETLEHIFEPFFTTKGVGEGTGLGLATVYGIVKQNNGYINVYSEPGKGTTFKIYLPRHVLAETAQAAVAAPAKPPRGTETILMVEDEKSVRLTTHMFLEDLGYTVLVAENPEKALALVAQHPAEIHLLITDVIMPGMSGRDLAQRLSELRPAIKRLFISGFTADVIAQRGILDDGVNFLSKPFGRDALARKVREVLEAGERTRTQ